ncbi:hypothetical protein K8O68_12660 [Salipaludibacillus sp. CUR1]|uniref:hypothetical protein n=1 Tax=Salipaludibacillus sp. CUR1 TaxID=2820003 RepID=UPI001E5C0D11|nr:hypothetical protein [Salipaludibacillus sp. CUR1]MCE7793271.1 hypothetical protein [Salipaludibacillus sp. CUR1]
MNKKDVLKDIKRLLSDLEMQDRSTVIRSEESRTKSGLPIKTDYVLRGRTGLTNKDKEDREQ